MESQKNKLRDFLKRLSIFLTYHKTELLLINYSYSKPTHCLKILLLFTPKTYCSLFRRGNDMGAIKDIVDSITQLNNSILKIQTLILTVQEEDAALVSENLDLKRRYLNLKKSILHLRKSILHFKKNLLLKIYKINMTLLKNLASINLKNLGIIFAPLV
jgi:hypothetical protein